MSSTHQQLWEKCREFLRDNISLRQFTVWFSDVYSVSFEDNILRLHVPSPYFAEQLDRMFINVLSAGIKKVYGTGVSVKYVYETVQGDTTTNVQVQTSNQSATILRNAQEAPANPFIDQAPRQFDSQLNPKYNFENYCVGHSNEIAYTIAEAIANDPSNKTFNPLFVFGSTGVGKTHLIQAIGIRIKERNPQARVLYVTARLFQSQYTAANHKGQINNFFHFYQSIDTLIVDDVQDLAGKPDTQNTFFHIFNQLHQNNRQIILSSDCAPSEMDGFEARLLNRFKWGASAALDKPDLELRRKVLHKKADQDGLDLQEEVIEYVAENVTDSIRELEGVVASLMAHATVLNCEITLDLARVVVANSIRVKRSQVNFEKVSLAVAEHFKIDPDQIYSKTRKREISDARQMIMYLAKKIVGMSFKSIGNKLGRTHATVLYACNTIEQRIPLDKELQNTIEEIKNKL